MPKKKPAYIEVTLDVVVLLPAKILVQENPRPAGRR